MWRILNATNRVNILCHELHEPFDWAQDKLHELSLIFLFIRWQYLLRTQHLG
jgi:hypothetical protein